jgi:hypothetical protein
MKAPFRTCLNYIICAFLACATACFDDDIYENIKNENDDLYYYVTEPDTGLRTSFHISDTGSTESILVGDDGYYQNTPSAMRFTIYNNYANNDDIVLDDVTGLMWTKCSALDGLMDTSDDCSGSKDTYSWQQASTFCDELNFAGYSEWRLPTVAELFSIVNFNEIYPAIDPTIFPSTAVGKYWTSTELYFFAFFRWYVNFDSRELTLLNVDEADPASAPDPENYVRCVCTGR